MLGSIVKPVGSLERHRLAGRILAVLSIAVTLALVAPLLRTDGPLGAQAVAALSVPGAPAPVVPEREVVETAADDGPTVMSRRTLQKDAVWGPQGSPYVVTDQLTVPTGRALTLLPGVIVKFGPDATMVVEGQLLSLGSPKDPVTLTSIKDDSVGGDTNGDGDASEPGRGDWRHVVIHSKPIGGSAEVNPVSVIDYTHISFGGATSGSGCLNSGQVDVAGPHGRAIITNSSFRESFRSGVKSNGTSSGDYPGLVGVYGNRFEDSNCGVFVRNGDIAGNYFDGSMRAALYSLYSEDVMFRHNVVESPVVSDHGVGVVFRFNHLSTVDGAGLPRQRTGDYRWNYWGDNPEREDPLQSAPPTYLPGGVTRAYHPTYGPVDTGLGALNYSVEDMTVLDAGKSLVANRSYSSHPQGTSSDMGPGWRTSFSESLTRGADGAVSMEAGDGAEIPFGAASESGRSDHLA